MNFYITVEKFMQDSLYAKEKKETKNAIHEFSLTKYF